jgi:hypothetical protein
MAMHGRGAAAAGGLVVVGMLASLGWAADDKALGADVLKLAGTIQQKDQQAARAQADAIAKKAELEDIMGLFRLRAKKGLGLGETPGAIKPDGIEAKIINLGKHAPKPAEMSQESQALARAGYVAAAIAMATEGKCPVERKQGEKDPEKWRGWMEDMRKSAVDFAAAAEAGRPADVKAAATRLNASCNNCHAAFRE